MKSIVLIGLIWCLPSLVFASNVSVCHWNFISTGDAAIELGRAWQTADWRNGMHPMRFYNYDALKRVVADPDLRPMAKKWLELSEGGDSKLLLEEVYSYIVNLGDLRLHYEIPLYGNEGKRKPLLDILHIFLEAHEDPEQNEYQALDIMSAFNRFFHPDAGFYSDRDEEYRTEFLNGWVAPIYHRMMMERAIRF